MQRFGENDIESFSYFHLRSINRPVYRERRSKTNYTLRGLFKSLQDYQPTQYLLRPLFRSLENVKNIPSRPKWPVPSFPQTTNYQTSISRRHFSRPLLNSQELSQIEAQEILRIAQAAVPWPPLAPNLQYSRQNALKTPSGLHRPQFPSKLVFNPGARRQDNRRDIRSNDYRHERVASRIVKFFTARKGWRKEEDSETLGWLWR